MAQPVDSLPAQVSSYQPVVFGQPAISAHAGTFAIPFEILQEICKRLREYGDTVVSMRYLSRFGRACRYIGRACFSPAVIAPLLSRKSSLNPTVPLSLQRKLASHCTHHIKKWVVHNLPNDCELMVLKETVAALPNLKKLVICLDEDTMDLYGHGIKKFIDSLDAQQIQNPQSIQLSCRYEKLDKTRGADTEDFCVLSVQSSLEDFRKLMGSPLPEKLTLVELYIPAARLEDVEEKMNLLKTWQGWTRAKRVKLLNDENPNYHFSGLVQSIIAPNVEVLYLKESSGADAHDTIKAIPQAFPRLKRVAISNYMSRMKGLKVLLSPEKGLKKLYALDLSRFDQQPKTADSALRLKKLHDLCGLLESIQELSISFELLKKLSDSGCQLKAVKVLRLSVLENGFSSDPALWNHIQEVAPNVEHLSLQQFEKDDQPVSPGVSLSRLRCLKFVPFAVDRENLPLALLARQCARFRNVEIQLSHPIDPLRRGNLLARLKPIALLINRMTPSPDPRVMSPILEFRWPIFIITTGVCLLGAASCFMPPENTLSRVSSSLFLFMTTSGRVMNVALTVIRQIERTLSPPAITALSGLLLFGDRIADPIAAWLFGWQNRGP